MKTSSDDDKIKIRLNYFNHDFILDAYILQTSRYINPIVYLDGKMCVTLLKQFVKKNYPDIMVWVNRYTIPKGASIRCYMSKRDYSKVDRTDYLTIDAFIKGLINDEPHVKSGKGTIIKTNLKRVVVVNQIPINAKLQ